MVSALFYWLADRCLRDYSVQRRYAGLDGGLEASNLLMHLPDAPQCDARCLFDQKAFWVVARLRSGVGPEQRYRQPCGQRCGELDLQVAQLVQDSASPTILSGTPRTMADVRSGECDARPTEDEHRRQFFGGRWPGIGAPNADVNCGP